MVRRTKKMCGDGCECNDCSKLLHKPEPMVEPLMVEQVEVVVPKKRGRKPKEKVKKVKQPSDYASFVKASYDSARHLPPNERFKFIAGKWKEHKLGKQVASK